MFFEANRIFNDRLVTYEDKSKFEGIIHKVYADLRLNLKYEGDYKVSHTVNSYTYLYIILLEKFYFEFIFIALNKPICSIKFCYINIIIK